MYMGNLARHRAWRLGSCLFATFLFSSTLYPSIGWTQITSSGLGTTVTVNGSSYDIAGGTA
jgi:hypothetical protein